MGDAVVTWTKVGLILNLARAQWLIGLSYRSHLKGLPCSSLLTWKETSLFEIGDQIDSVESVSFVCLQYPHLPASETLGGEKNNARLYFLSPLELSTVSAPAFRKTTLISLIRALKCDSALWARKNRMTNYAQMCLLNQMSWHMVISWW